MKNLINQSTRLNAELMKLRQKALKANMLSVRPVIEEMAKKQEELNLLNHKINVLGVNNGE